MKKTISTDLAPAAIGPYSQAIQSGELLFVSGQIPINPATGELVSNDIAAETRQCLENLKAILDKANTDFAHVMKTTIFLKSMDDFAAVNEVYASFFMEPFPARACVEVARLPKDVRVEIDAIARVPA